MATLPTDADSSPNYTAAQHATHHNTLHGLWNVSTTKGDLIVVTGAEAYTRLAVGTDGHVLTADAASSPGVKWAAQSGTTAWADWTPALTAVTTNPTLGSGSATTGRWCQTNKLVVGNLHIQFGSSGYNAGSGEYRISLPVAPATFTPLISVGHGLVWPGSSSVVTVEAFLVPSATTMKLYIGGTGLIVAHNVPVAWASGQIELSFSYEAA